MHKPLIQLLVLLNILFFRGKASALCYKHLLRFRKWAKSAIFLFNNKKALSNRLFYIVSIHLEGIEPPSQEPESCVISITLKVAPLTIPLQYSIKVSILKSFFLKRSHHTHEEDAYSYFLIICVLSMYC